MVCPRPLSMRKMRKQSVSSDFAPAGTLDKYRRAKYSPNLKTGMDCRTQSAQMPDVRQRQNISICGSAKNVVRRLRIISTPAGSVRRQKMPFQRMPQETQAQAEMAGRNGGSPSNTFAERWPLGMSCSARRLNLPLKSARSASLEFPILRIAATEL